MADLTLGELFAGVGGFSLGFEAEGYRTRWQAEIDPHCQQVLARHWPDAVRYGDVTEIDGASLEPVDVITFGSPCQDLSVAGKRAGLDGARSGLFFEAIRIVKEMRDATVTFPRWAVWENVPGALRSNNGRDFAVAVAAIRDLGANALEWAVVDARFFGVPQRRRRLLCVADLDPRASTERPLLPLAEGGRRNPATQSGLVGFYSKHGKYDRAVADAVPPLVIGTGLGIPTACAVVGMGQRPRRLTPLESERAMGWPDDHTRWLADGDEQDDVRRYRQCGNGVVAPMARWLARNLAETARVTT